MTSPTMPALDLPPEWTVLEREVSRTVVRLRVAARDNGSADLTLSRSLATALRDAYPVSTHDVQVELEAIDLAPVDLTRLLRDVVTTVERADPSCRRVVHAVSVADLSATAAAEQAGFRFVVQVDVDEQELSLLVAEPAWVTRTDGDLEKVPGT